MSTCPPIDLDSLRIATPCTVSWDAMTGDARKRFCGQCRLNVYDVSALTRGEAEALVTRGEGRVCLRLHRRADGRVVTKDCGRVRAAIARRVRWMRAAAASVLAIFGFAGCSRVAEDPQASPGGVEAPPLRPSMGDVRVPPDPSTMGRPMMGVVRPPSPPLQPTMGEAVATPPSEAGMELGGVRRARLEPPRDSK